MNEPRPRPCRAVVRACLLAGSFASPVIAAAGGSAEAGRGADSLELGSAIELEAHHLADFALDTRARDDLLRREAELVGEVTWRPRADVLAFGELALVAEREDHGGDRPDESADALERGETWVQFERAFGRELALTLGRPAFSDPRSWWWDDDLDGLRMDLARGDWDATLGLAQELAPTSTSDDFIDPEAEDVRRLLAHAGWRHSDALRLDGFALVQRDRSGGFRSGRVIDSERVDESDLDARWLGLRVSGVIAAGAAAKLHYWADLATVSGDEVATAFVDLGDGRSRADGAERRRLRGRALDLGVEWHLATAAARVLGLRYAQGSGDRDPDDGTDRAYRETGLRDQDAEFRLYGELLRPELSNLRVGTISLGAEPGAGTRVTLGYHRFRQVYAADELAGSRLETDPTGASPDIGEEISLVVELEPGEDLELEFAAAIFRASDAFGARSGRRAHSLFGQLTWGFE
ncbi:MAG: alginate export family protein [Halofilum sp. (in: g-proteobacteria)]|nr:alginate export family protein [Halofilum sp. (in: g-proteobacteria)]